MKNANYLVLVEWVFDGLYGCQNVISYHADDYAPEAIWDAADLMPEEPARKSFSFICATEPGVNLQDN